MKNQNTKIWASKCECGVEVFFNEKPHPMSPVVFGDKHGVFPLICNTCGHLHEAKDFKMRIEIGKHDIIDA